MEPIPGKQNKNCVFQGKKEKPSKRKRCWNSCNNCASACIRHNNGSNSNVQRCRLPRMMQYRGRHVHRHALKIPDFAQKKKNLTAGYEPRNLYFSFFFAQKITARTIATPRSRAQLPCEKTDRQWPSACHWPTPQTSPGPSRNNNHRCPCPGKQLATPPEPTRSSATKSLPTLKMTSDCAAATACPRCPECGQTSHGGARRARGPRSHSRTKTREPPQQWPQSSVGCTACRC